MEMFPLVQSHLRSEGKSSAYRVLTFISFVHRTERASLVFMLRDMDAL